MWTSASGLKELLERDTADTVRAVLRISPCDFTAENRRGFCLSIRLVAEGSSAQQAELRWGLGLARIQQALLFRSRALKQQIANESGAQGSTSFKSRRNSRCASRRSFPAFDKRGAS